MYIAQHYSRPQTVLAEETAGQHSALDWTVLDIATKPGHELKHIPIRFLEKSSMTTLAVMHQLGRSANS